MALNFIRKPTNKTETAKPQSKFIKAFSDKLYTAATVVPALVMMIIGAVYNFSVIELDLNIVSEIPMMIAVLTLLSLIASTVLSFVHGRKFSLVFFSVIFVLAIIGWIGMSAGGAEMNGFLMLLFAFSMPTYSYLPILSAISSSSSAPIFIVTGLLAAMNIAGAVYLTVKKNREEIS